MSQAPPYDHFGPFIIIRPLGRGGMGEVYIARTRLERAPLVAVKRLRPDVARVPTFAERFKHEADLAVRLDHRNVVSTVDVGSVHSQLYVASELILGKDTGYIADRLRERGLGAPVAVVIRILLDVLHGLSYVHGVRDPDSGRSIGLVHRDVTPGNVLISYDGISKLADFGLAKSELIEGGKLTQHGEILGTPHYLAPEVIQGEDASSASDLYGLGAVMYRVLTGVPPHQGTTAEVLFKSINDAPRHLSKMRPDLPAWFASFVHEMLERDPSDRPKDAGELARRLERAATDAKLLLGHASVGRWLGQLFEEERSKELAERDRLQDIDPSEYPEPIEGTVVLARVRPGTALLAPVELPEDQGTELDHSAEAIRAAAEAVEPASLDEEVENLQTWAMPFDGQMSDTPKVRSFDDEEGTEFEAKVITPSGPRKLDDILDADTGEGGGGFGDEFDTQLPGFVDGGARSSDSNDTAEADPDQRTAIAKARPSRAAEPSPRGEKRRRPRNPDSVVVGPADPGSEPVPAEAMDPSLDQAEVFVPRLSPSMPTDKARAPSPPLAPDRAYRAPPPALPTPARVRVSSGRGPFEMLLLAVLGVLFVGGGVLLGLTIAEPNRGSAVSAEESQLRARFVTLRAELERRKAEGRPVSAETWSMLLDASSALLSGDDARARALVDVIERSLSLPTPVETPRPVVQETSTSAIEGS